MNFLKKNLRFPTSVRKAGGGIVYASFVVRGVDGVITDVKVIRGINSDGDQEAMRVVKLMPPWKPGKQAGEPVNVRFVLPIKFDVKEHRSR